MLWMKSQPEGRAEIANVTIKMIEEIPILLSLYRNHFHATLTSRTDNCIMDECTDYAKYNWIQKELNDCKSIV